jgi:SSS family solute:Na+ symporter
LESLAIGTFISLLTGAHPVLGTILGSLVVIIYTTVGGLRADIRTDIFQFFVMLVLLFVFLPLVIMHAGGIRAITHLPSSFLLGSAFAPPYVYILMFFFIGTGAITSADLWQRVYASDSGKNARWAMNVAGVLVTIFFIMAILFGLYGKVLLPMADANNIFPAMMELTLPHGLFGLVLAGFFAAILSTVDTVLLLTSMTIVHDLYQKTLLRNLAAEEVLRVSRWVTLFLGLIGLAVALIVFNIVHLAIEAVSFYIVLFPAIVFGFYSKRRSNEAAFWSIVIGSIVMTVFLFIDPVQAFIPGLLTSLVVFLVVWVFEGRKTP